MDTTPRLGLNDPIFAGLAKQFFRFLRSDPFSRRIGDGSVGDTLMNVFKPLIDEALEIEGLVIDREIELKSFEEYFLAVSSNDTVIRSVCELAAAVVRRRETPKDMQAVTKVAGSLIVGLRECAHHLQRGKAVGKGAIIHVLIHTLDIFVIAYVEALYAQYTVKRVLEGANAATMLNTFKQARSYLARLAAPDQEVMERINGIGTYLDYSLDESFAPTMRAMMTIESLGAQDMHEFVEAIHGLYFGSVDAEECFAQLPTQNGSLQCYVRPLGDDMRESTRSGLVSFGYAEIQFSVVPPGHSGFYAKRSNMLAFVQAGAEKIIFPSNRPTFFSVAMSGEQFNCLNDNVIRLVYEAFAREYRLGAPVPQGIFAAQIEPRAIETMVAPEPQEEGEYRLPRDLKAADLIALIRSMNRVFYRDQGITGEELDSKTEPWLRQSGSHATIFCAETNRIAPVPVHSTALRIGTLRNILRILRLEPARLFPAQ